MTKLIKLSGHTDIGRGQGTLRSNDHRNLLALGADDADALWRLHLQATGVAVVKLRADAMATGAPFLDRVERLKLDGASADRHILRLGVIDVLSALDQQRV